MAPNNNRGMTYQTNEKHLTYKRILCWCGYNIVFYYVSIPIIALNIYHIVHQKTLKMLLLRVFGPPTLASYLQDVNFNFTKCSENHQQTYLHNHPCLLVFLIQPKVHTMCRWAWGSGWPCSNNNKVNVGNKNDGGDNSRSSFSSLGSAVCDPDDYWRDYFPIMALSEDNILHYFPVQITHEVLTAAWVWKGRFDGANGISLSWWHTGTGLHDLPFQGCSHCHCHPPTLKNFVMENL